MQPEDIGAPVTAPLAQAEHAFCPASEKVPGAQPVHTVAPALAANVPAAHGVHVAALGVLEKVPAEQSAQTLLQVAEQAVTSWLPGPQTRQA